MIISRWRLTHADGLRVAVLVSITKRRAAAAIRRRVDGGKLKFTFHRWRLGCKSRAIDGARIGLTTLSDEDGDEDGVSAFTQLTTRDSRAHPLFLRNTPISRSSIHAR